MIFFKPMTTEHEWRWVRNRARCIKTEDSCGIVAYNDQGTIQAICVMDSFTSASCMAHMAIDNPTAIRRGFLQEVSHFLFNTMRLERVFGLVPTNNKKALKFDKHIGFTKVAEVPGVFEGNIGYSVLKMERDECRWLVKNEEAA